MAMLLVPKAGRYIFIGAGAMATVYSFMKLGTKTIALPFTKIGEGFGILSRIASGEINPRFAVQARIMAFPRIASGIVGIAFIALMVTTAILILNRMGKQKPAAENIKD